MNWGNTQLVLSTTTGDVNDRSLVFSENHGPNETLVYDAPLTLSTEATGPPEGPRNFDYSIDLQRPFLYAPGLNLIVDFTSQSGYTPNFGDDQLVAANQNLLEVPFNGAELGFFGNNSLILQFTFVPTPLVLQAGDANQDLEFNFDDILAVLAAGKFETGQPATWSDGDWDGAPGGSPGNPPPGDGFFNFDDILAALSTGLFETGPYAAIGVEEVSPTDRAAAAVPEPSTVVLLTFGIVALAVCTRRKTTVR